MLRGKVGRLHRNRQRSSHAKAWQGCGRAAAGHNSLAGQPNRMSDGGGGAHCSVQALQNSSHR